MKWSRILAATCKNRPIARSQMTEPKSYHFKSYRFGQFVVDRRSACLRCDGAVLPLRPKTFDVLVYLVQHPGRLVPKAELIDSVWQSVNVTENSLVQCIKEIRQALGDDTQTKVETVSKRGYLFASPVVEIEGQELNDAGGGVAGLAAGADRALPLPDRASIAVLPFDNMSGDPDQEYFADGISEDLITALSRIRWLFVIARNSTFVYKHRAVDVRQVARDLGVRYVLEGSVRRAGNRLRISAQLIDALSGSHHWAEQYDRELGEIFAVQDEITRSVVGAIEPRLLAAEGVRALSRSSDDLGAWELVGAGANPALACHARGLRDRDRHFETDGDGLSGLRAGAKPAGVSSVVCRAYGMGRSGRRAARRPRARGSRDGARQQRSLGSDRAWLSGDDGTAHRGGDCGLSARGRPQSELGCGARRSRPLPGVRRIGSRGDSACGERHQAQSARSGHADFHRRHRGRALLRRPIC